MAMQEPEPQRSIKERRFEIINRVTTSVTQSLDLATVLNAALQETMAVFGVDSGGIYIVDERTQQLELAVEHKLTKAFVDKLSRISLGQGCAGTAAVTQEMFAAFDRPEAEYICADAEQLMGIDCLVAAPMITKGRVLGVLELFAPVSRRLTDDEAELLQSICNQVAIAVENAKLFSREQKAHDEVREALEDSTLLLQSAQTISASLELGDILERLTALTAKLTGIKRISIWLFDPEADEVTVGAIIDPAYPGVIQVGHHFKLADLGPIADVLDGMTTLLSDLSTLPPPMRELSERIGRKSLLGVPIKFREEVVGAMLLDNPDEAHEFSLREIQLAEGIALQAAAAIENARAFERQRTIAETLQKGLLPRALPQVSGLEIAGFYRPATGRVLVGGDFYDFISLDGTKIGLVVGDVSGKGVQAATATSIVKNTVHALALENPSPAAVLTRTNLTTCQQVEPWQFITLVYTVIDGETGELHYSDAGHPPPVLYRPGPDRFEDFAFGGLPLGIFTDHLYEEHHTVLQPDDLLVLYTDGITEAKGDRELFGEERLRQLVHDYSHLGCRALCRTIVNEARRFARDRLVDDVVIVAVKKK